MVAAIDRAGAADVVERVEEDSHTREVIVRNVAVGRALELDSPDAPGVRRSGPARGVAPDVDPGRAADRDSALPAQRVVRDRGVIGFTPNRDANTLRRSISHDPRTRTSLEDDAARATLRRAKLVSFDRGLGAVANGDESKARLDQIVLEREPGRPVHPDCGTQVQKAVARNLEARSVARVNAGGESFDRAIGYRDVRCCHTNCDTTGHGPSDRVSRAVQRDTRFRNRQSRRSTNEVRIQLRGARLRRAALDNRLLAVRCGAERSDAEDHKQSDPCRTHPVELLTCRTLQRRQSRRKS